jgi:hypothetical protein
MEAAKTPLHAPGGGMSRLLGDCEAVGRVTAADAASVRYRLEGALGPDLASRLVGALAPHPGRTAF